jgi:hypothetical protein
MKTESLSQFSKKEKALNRLAMFEFKILQYSMDIQTARKNNDKTLEDIYINQIIQCEKMILICKNDLNNL